MEICQTLSSSTLLHKFSPMSNAAILEKYLHGFNSLKLEKNIKYNTFILCQIITSAIKKSYLKYSE